MAVVLAAYGCQYAMHLDMNAPEHTYFALYKAGGGKLVMNGAANTYNGPTTISVSSAAK